jgi:hypothetical protein
MASITSDTTVAAATETVSTELDGERVLLNIETGMYHGMNAVGAEIFEHLEQPTSVAELSKVISERYDVDQERAEEDVRAFFDSLLEAELAEVRHSTLTS